MPLVKTMFSTRSNSAMTRNPRQHRRFRPDLRDSFRRRPRKPAGCDRRHDPDRQGCPEHVNISAQVKSRVEQLPGVRNANVNILWEPAWTPERLSRKPANSWESSESAVRRSLFVVRQRRSVFSQLLKRARGTLSANSSILPPILIARSRNRVPCRTYDGSSSESEQTAPDTPTPAPLAHASHQHRRRRLPFSSNKAAAPTDPQSPPASSFP